MKYKIFYYNNFPGSPNPGEVKEKVMETDETKDRLLQHNHVIKVEEVKENKKQIKGEVIKKAGRPKRK